MRVAAGGHKYEAIQRLLQTNVPSTSYIGNHMRIHYLAAASLHRRDSVGPYSPMMARKYSWRSIDRDGWPATGHHSSRPVTNSGRSSSGFDVRAPQCAAGETIARVDDLWPSRKTGGDLAQDRLVQLVPSLEHRQTVRQAG